jgi:flagellar basal body-associated protein FliL
MELPCWLVYPLAGALVYELAQPPLVGLFGAPLPRDRSAVPQKKKRTLLTYLIVLHNLLLCAYSGWSFVATSMAMIEHKDLIYKGNELFPHIERYVYIFYLSKYYEFVDTLILIVKRLPVSYLQSFHHAGAVVTMAASYYTGTSGAWVFVVFNSFIHTIMYLYYAAAAMGYRMPNKLIITRMQIAQFVLGCITTAPYVWMEEVPFMNRMTIVGVQGYVLALIVLFAIFFKGEKSKKRAAQKSTTEQQPQAVEKKNE